MPEPDYKAFYDVMMLAAQTWENLAEEWRGSSESGTLHTVVKAIATASEVYVPNGPIAHLASPVRKDEA